MTVHFYVVIGKPFAKIAGNRNSVVTAFAKMVDLSTEAIKLVQSKFDGFGCRRIYGYFQGLPTFSG